MRSITGVMLSLSKHGGVAQRSHFDEAQCDILFYTCYGRFTCFTRKYTETRKTNRICHFERAQ